MQKNKKGDRPEFWDEACKYLSRKDAVMKKLIATYKGEAPLRKNNGFHTIMRSIVGQQISVKAADSVWNKLMLLSKSGMDPRKIIKITEAQLRSAGLSGQKVKYIHNCAEFFLNEMKGKIDLIDEDHISIAEKLIRIKGVGKWTVEMFMIFHMHAPDIFPISDLGIVNAVKEQYGVKAKDKKTLEKKILKLSETWKPYRSVASWYLWRSLDPVALEY
jgi:DNA-3-methyladenine glycosylase II